MSKIKDIEKFQKEIEKIKPEKELKIEIKEKPEKREIKETKVEIKERAKDFKDIKEPIKEKSEKIEHKEFKEREKFFEGGGIDPGTVFRAEKPEEGAAAAPKPKEDPELKIQKEIEKIKPEKEFPDKLYKEKEIEKIKPEKEFPDKFHKEIEKIKPEKEFEKALVEGQQDPTTRPFKGTGSAEERLGELEDAVTKLSHFIGVDLRPDLSTGALKREPDVGEGTGGEAKPDDKKKPK